ncbi:hypothetical protein J6590_042189 [Homalodisca vitripennis]|nr:hypothetical protein J6590_042189 [Homalodisca vitripennis]
MILMMRGYEDRVRPYDEVRNLFNDIPIEIMCLNQEFKKQSNISRKQAALKTAPNWTTKNTYKRSIGAESTMMGPEPGCGIAFSNIKDWEKGIRNIKSQD